MTTTVVKVIGTAGDYTTVQAWEDASPADLTAVDEIWQGQLKNQAFTNSGANVITFAGVTTDSTRYIELTCQSGSSASDNASVQSNAFRYNTSNGASMSASAAYAGGSPVIVDTTVNVHLTGIQASSTNTESANAVEANSTGTAALIVSRCILESAGTIGNGALALSGSGCKVENSLIVARGGTVTVIATLNSGANAYNSTFVSSAAVATNGFAGGYGAPVIENCAVFNCAAVKTGGNSPTYTTCFTDVASPPAGFTTAAYSTSSGAKFQNITDGTHDFRLQSGSALIDAGTTDSTNAAVDFAGTARPSGASYDVGAWEFVGTVAPIFGSLGDFDTELRVEAWF